MFVAIQDERPGYRVEIASLNNLVLKPVAKKSSTTKLSFTDSPT